MRKKQNVSVNLILGLVVGVQVVIFILSQMNLLLSYLAIRNINYNVKAMNLVAVLLAGIAFWVSVKVFVSIKSKKLSLYFILSLIVAGISTISIAYLGTCLFALGVNQGRLLLFLESNLGQLLASSIVYVCLWGIVLVFVVIFGVMVNRKVRYLQYISDKVKEIERDDLNIVIEENGNDELTDLSKGINSMSSRLKDKLEKEKKIEQNKNELISNVSHDLRTPLTSVIGYVSLLKENGFQDKEKFDEYIEVVERRMDGLNTLINELFEYTKLTSADLQLDRITVDLISVVNHLIKEYRILYQKTGLEIAYTCNAKECMVDVDLNKMVRVFQNLLDNAKKYAKPGSTVGVTVTVSEQRFYFNIENEIEGLNRIEVERLFERFYKGDTARSDSDSSGLGLSIVKRIVELHDGELQVVVNGDRIEFGVGIGIGCVGLD